MSKNFQIKPQAYGFPSIIGGMTIKTISWKDFPAKPPADTWFLAYTYWNTNYTCTVKNGKGKAVSTVVIGPKAWTRAKQDFRLLQHQTGHYWVACLCALQFQKRVNYIQEQPKDLTFLQWCQKVFQRTSSQFFKQQKRYDKQTYHYLIEQQQERWKREMVQKFNDYHKFFQQKRKQQESNVLTDIKAKQGIKFNINQRASKQNLRPNQRGRQIKSVAINQKVIVPQKATIPTSSVKKPSQFSIRKQAVKPIANVSKNMGLFTVARNTLNKNINFLSNLG